MLRSGNSFASASGRRPREHYVAVTVTVALAGCAGLLLAKAELTFPGHVPALVALAAVLTLAVAALVLPARMTVAGFALLAFVRVEPAPVDLIFALLMFRTLAFDRTAINVPPPAMLATAGFAAWTVFSTSNADDFAAGLRFEFITLYLLLLAVWLTGTFSNGRLTRTCIKTYIYAAVASAALGVIALRVGFPGSSALVYGDARVKAFFKDPNVFSPFLIPAAVIVIEDIARPRLFSRRMRPGVLAMLLILVGGLIFAFSRAAWLNAGVGAVVLLAVMATRRGGARAVARILAALGAAGATAFVALSATGSTSFFESRTHLEAYDQTRFATQNSAFTKMWSHLFGYGPGQSERDLVQSTHSLFARVFFEQGFVGGMLLIAVLLATTVAAVSLALRRRDVHGVGSAALLAAWAGIVVNSVFVDTLHWRHLWIVAALIWCGAATAESPASREPVAPRPSLQRERERPIATAFR